MAVTLGIDVSQYQGSIDWAAVGSSSYRFALARMTIGRTARDNLGRRNLAGMLGHVAVSGAYGVVGTAEPVEDGAKLLVDEIAAVADPAKVLVMLDAEDFSDGSHPTIGQVNRYAVELHGLLGRWPIAYVPGWWLDAHGYTASGRELANCPWAPSHYIPAPWTEARLQASKPTNLRGFKSLAWLQYTDKARVAGISGSVDADCFYGDLNQLRARLLGQQEDLSIMDAATKEYLDGKFAGLHNDIVVVLHGDATHLQSIDSIYEHVTALEAKVDRVIQLLTPAPPAP